MYATHRYVCNESFRSNSDFNLTKLEPQKWGMCVAVTVQQSYCFRNGER